MSGADRSWKIIHLDQDASRQSTGAFDGVLELADIAGPTVRVPKILTPILPEILAPPAEAGGAKNSLRPSRDGARGEDVGHAQAT